MAEINLKKFEIIFFAAGIGKRLKKIGKLQPKCLITINNKKVIDYILQFLLELNADKINFVLGYKNKLIKDHLRKSYKDISFKFKTIKNFRKFGHGYTWYQSHSLVSRKQVLIIHADIIFQKELLSNILINKEKNILGVKKCSNKKEIAYCVKSSSKNKAQEIKKIIPNQVFNHEIIGINKLSKKEFFKIHVFMKKFFKDSCNKTLSWEQVINYYIKKNPNAFKIIKDNNFKWVNINREKDLKAARKIFKV
jgi:choline kinase